MISKGEEYLRNISKNLKINFSLAFNILNKLHDSQFIVLKKVGREVQYYLNRNADYNILVNLLEEYRLEQTIEKVKILKSIINLLINNKELMKSSSKIYLFGSYVLFVNENRKLVGKTFREIDNCWKGLKLLNLWKKKV